MAEFTPINTQEEFDAAIKDRIARERAKYSDYESIKSERDTLKTEKETFNQTLETLKSEKANLQTQLDEVNGKVKGFELEKLRREAAKAARLDESLAGRLKGETAEELQEDAKELAKIVGKRHLPAFDPESAGAEGADGKKAALKEVLNNLNLKES